MSDNFRNRLQQLLDEHGMKAVDLANAINAPKARISQWMNGKTNPNSNSLYQVAQYFNVSEGWLLGNEVPKKIDRQRLEQEVELCEIFERCHGANAYKIVHEFLKLDELDRGKIAERIETLLEADKYQVKKESSNRLAM